MIVRNQEDEIIIHFRLQSRHACMHETHARISTHPSVSLVYSIHQNQTDKLKLLDSGVGRN